MTPAADGYPRLRLEDFSPSSSSLLVKDCQRNRRNRRESPNPSHTATISLLVPAISRECVQSSTGGRPARDRKTRRENRRSNDASSQTFCSVARTTAKAPTNTVISKDFRYLVVFVSLDLCNPRIRYRHDVCSLPRTVVAQTCRRLFLLIIPRFDSQLLQRPLIVCISSNEANRSGRPVNYCC